MLVKEEEQEGYRREFRHFATQYASAISQFEVDDGQWVGRLLRVYSNFEGPGEGDEALKFGVKDPEPLSNEDEIRAVQLVEREKEDKAAAAEAVKFLDFLKGENISDIAISDVTYTIDPNDKEGLHFFVRGFIDINESEGKVLAKGKRYSFEHRIKKTYHTRKTIIKEVGLISDFKSPVDTKPDTPVE